MSTILDALNRAERERRMGELPAIERLLEPPGLASLPPERQFPGRATIVTVAFMVGLGLVAAIVALMRAPPQGAYPGPFASFAGTLAPQSSPPPAENPPEGRRAVLPEPGPASLNAASSGQTQAASMQEAGGGPARTPEYEAAPEPMPNRDLGNKSAHESGADHSRRKSTADTPAQEKSAQDSSSPDKPTRDKPAPARPRQDPTLAQQPPAPRPAVATPPQPSRLAEHAQSAVAPQRATVASLTPARTAKQAASDTALATDKAAPAKAVEKPLPGLHELSSSLRAQLPEIKLGGYIYSPNPAARSILINGKLLREGDQLITGLRLEQMRPDGVVFEYKDVRFRMAY